MARGLSRDDVGVTPVIGTILVLAISVAGIGLTLFMGTPVLQRLQDQAALESALGQMKEVRAEAGRLAAPNTSVAVGFNLPGGKLGIEPGTRTLVTMYEDVFFPNCDLRIRSWEDGDGTLTFSWTTTPVGLCRTPAVDHRAVAENLVTIATCDASATATVTVGGTSVGLPAMGCVHAYRLSDRSTNRINNGNVSGCNALPPLDPVVYTCDTGAQTTISVAKSEDWLFRMDNDPTGNATSPTVYWEAWLLHSDRLTWTRSSTGSSVRSAYENGVLFGQGQNQVYLQSPIPVLENASSTTANSFLVRLPTWQSSAFGAVSGEGVQAVRVTYDGGSRLTSANVYSARFDFQGDLAQAWCNALLHRDQAPGVPTGTVYATDPNDLTRTCTPTSPNSDRIRGLLYDALPNNSVTTFPFTILQQTLHARLDS
jgi:hypothetical protein